MKKTITLITLLIILTIFATSCGQSNQVDNPSTDNTIMEDNKDDVIEDNTENEMNPENNVEVEPEDEVQPEQPKDEVPEVEPEQPYTFTELSETKYATSNLNVRNLPSKEGEKIGSISYNEEIQVTGQCNETGWYRIMFEGKEGFVSNEYVTAEKIQEPEVEESWVADLKVTQNANQIIVVSATGDTATISMHVRNTAGYWTELLSSSGHIGANGVGKTKEGDRKTPSGVYGFMFGFGTEPNPGTAMEYVQVDAYYYWVSDSNSKYYNKFVTNYDPTLEIDWEESQAEFLGLMGDSYRYVLATTYNEECVPGKGSAIFLHCEPTSGAGCITVPETIMIQILQNVQPGCVLLIDEADKIMEY